MNTDEIKAGEGAALCRTYARYPLAISRGEGTKLYTPEGREYTDLLAGIAVCNLGHSHPELAEIIAAQAKKLIHVSNLFYQEEQVTLARKLLATCHLERVFSATPEPRPTREPSNWPGATCARAGARTVTKSSP